MNSAWFNLCICWGRETQIDLIFQLFGREYNILYLITMSVSFAFARQMRSNGASVFLMRVQKRSYADRRQCSNLKHVALGSKVPHKNQARSLTSGVSCSASGDNFSFIQDSVQNYYGKILETSKDLKTNACTTSDRPSDIVVDALRKVPTEVQEKYYGCGSPVPLGIDGLDVLDLGSGSGQDCYIAAALVGNQGSVTGKAKIRVPLVDVQSRT